jgi:hypothetical protein
MNCNACAGGTIADSFIYGKQKYIEEKAPGLTRYAAQYPFDWTVTPARPMYVTSLSPTFGFLYAELIGRADVEILINGDFNHYLTLTSLHWNDADNDLIIDMDENAMMDFVDPDTGMFGMAEIFANGDFIGTNYGGGLSNVVVAVSEDSIPEPSTVALVGVGFGATLLRRRNRVSD